MSDLPRIPPVTETKRPFWSVMIPVHQPDLALLREAVDSVLRTGLNPATSQIALVDDAGGPPELEAYFAEVTSRGIEVIRAPRATGLVGNWNHSLAHARGEWVHLLHQDDRVRSDFYTALTRGIRREPTLGAAFTQTAFIDERGAWLRDGHLRQAEAGLLDAWIEHLLVNLAVQCPAMVVRRAVYERLGGFDPRFAYCSDAEMWVRIAAEYPVWFEPQPLAEYRTHPASATQRLFPLPTRWRERAVGLECGLRLLSPAIRARARTSGRHYRTRLAWLEWQQAWRTATRPEQRLRLLSWLRHLGSLRDLHAIRNRRYPAPIPGQATLRPADPAAPRTPRLLLLSEFFPYPPERAVYGVYQRLYRTCQGLTRAGHLDAAFFWSDNHPIPDPVVEKFRQEVAAVWPLPGALHIISPFIGKAAEFHRHPVRALYWLLRGAASFQHARPSMRCCGPVQVARLRHVLHTRQPDLILAHRMGVIGPLIRLRQALPPVVFDLDDIEHIKVHRLHATGGLNWSALRSRVWTWMARHSEQRAATLAAVTLVCSEEDRTALRTVVARADIEVIPNTARLRPAQPAVTEPYALFVGIAHYPPNREAIEWLVNEIWPQVRARRPEARLRIVGEGAEKLLEPASNPGVDAVGFAADLEGYYREAAFTVCPIRRGSGTRIKIVESAFCARPVVATTIGAEGLSFTPGTEILIANDTNAFAEACLSLMDHPDRRAAMGQAIRRKALTDYDPELVVNRLAAIVQTQLHHASAENHRG